MNSFCGFSELREGGILPDPDLNTDDEAESEPDADALIPDDSLADTDLHDHDLIDSVMYIYFGASDRDEGGVGKQVYHSFDIDNNLTHRQKIKGFERV